MGGTKMKKAGFLVTGSVFFTFGLAALMLMVTPSMSLAKPIELKMSVEHSTKANKYLRGHAPWAKKVEEATKGKVKVTVYPANSLSKARERVDATIDGIHEIGWLALPHFSGRFPLTEVFALSLIHI